jgi:hypothetical protein
MIVVCPHCQEFIEILEINCAIFRHGVFKDGLKQIDPHETKQQIDMYKIQDVIYGCGKPFKLVNDVPEICGYI